MTNDWDGILGQYSAPVRSWPGEEAMDEEARANLAAMTPAAPEKLRPDEAYRGAFLPFRETVSGQHEWAVPGFLRDVWDSAKAVRDTSGTGLGPMIRPSKLPLEEMEQIIGHSMAGAMTGVTGGLARAAVAPRLPSGTTELGIFGGRLAKTADHAALARAEEMAAAGVPREKIWSDTGWFTGPDGKWKFEIDDSGAKIVNDRGRLGDALQHDDLFSSYPSLSKADLLLEPAAGGRYVPREWNKAEGRNAPESIGIGEDHYRRYPGVPTPESVALHEAQHGVQAREGFASGADLDNLRAIARSAHPNADPAAIDAAVHEAYLQHAGEVEARAVQARRDLSPDERLSRPPWLDYDVPEADQIVSRAGGRQDMFAGRRGADNLAAKGETRPLQALDMLERMERDGASREEIWAATNDILKDSPYAGAFRGVDEKPRFEIDDSASRWKPDIAEAGLDVGEAIEGFRGGFGRSPKMNDLFEHPTVYDAYPGLEKLGVEAIKDLSARGSYDNAGMIRLNTLLTDDNAIKSTNLHELQHVIQQGDDFARGYNPIEAAKDIAQARFREQELRDKTQRWQNAHTDEARVYETRARNGDPEAAEIVNASKRWMDQLGAKSDDNPYGITPVEAIAAELGERDAILQRGLREYNDVFRTARLSPEELYKMQAGEAEARTVQKRQDLTPDERRSRPPWLDYDVPESDQIVRFRDRGPQMSSESPLPMDEASRLARARELGFDTPAYHATGVVFDEFKRHPFRGASFFARTEADASKGATAGFNDLTGTGSSRMMKVMLPSEEIVGLALTPAEKEWWKNLPDKVSDDGYGSGISEALGKRPENISSDAKHMPWYYIYDEKQLPNGQFEYTKLPMPKLDWEAAAKSNRDVYGSQWPHYGKGSERFSSDHATRNGMSGFAHQDEAGLSIGMVAPHRIRDVNAAFDPAKKDSANLLASHRVPLPVSRDDDRRESLDELLKLYSKEQP